MSVRLYLPCIQRSFRQYCCKIFIPSPLKSQPQNVRVSCRLQLSTTVSSASIEEKSGDKPAFSGDIPINELDIKYVTSGGAGGQNVNKLNTKVQIRFHVENATWIPDHIKPKFLDLAKPQINKDGFFYIYSERTRKQMLNQADCLQKIRSLIFKAGKEELLPSEEDLKLKAARIAKAQRSILRQKREHSLIKQTRSGPAYET